VLLYLAIRRRRHVAWPSFRPPGGEGW